MYRKYNKNDYERIRDTKTLTKEDIEHMAREVMSWITHNGKEAWIFYNGKEAGWTWEGSYKDGHYKKFVKERHHKDFCKWFPDYNILSMSVDGAIYEKLNYGERGIQVHLLQGILARYGCYLDYMDACYWYVTPLSRNYDWNIEYTK